MSSIRQDAIGVAGWLTPHRARAWCSVLAVLVVVWLLVLGVRLVEGSDRIFNPVAADFVCFWAAATLAASGRAAAAYDPFVMISIEHAVQPILAGKVAPFLYPPTYLLLCLPLALLSFVAASLAFLAAGTSLILVCLRALLPQPWAVLPIVSFPGILVTAGAGQNDLFAASCFAAGMVMLERQPVLAGACLGLLTCKPQLSLLVPVMLLAGRRWAALAGFAGASALLALAAAAAFGPRIWLVFPDAAAQARRILETELVDPTQMQSVFGAVRILHGGLRLAYGLQLLGSLAAGAVAVLVARRRPGARAEGAVLATASLAVSPYVMDYDLVILAAPLAWLAGEASGTRWRPWEKYVALAAYMMPLLSHGIARSAGVPLGPLTVFALLSIVAARASTPTGPGAKVAPA